MQRAPRIAALLVAGLLLHASADALARPDKDRDEQRSHREMPSGLLAPGFRDSRDDRQWLSPDQAAREIQSRHGGRVLSVQPDGAGYRVKTLKDGEVRIYQVNP